MKRLIWLPVAGFLVIAGATVAAAAPALAEDARDVLSPRQAGTSSVTVDGIAFAHPGRDLLADVLADLVSDGTITQAQSDAVTQALQDKADERMAEMEARMELMQEIVVDGVVTQDEIGQLPADDPLRAAFDSIANDGQVSLDQLRAIGPFGGPGGPGHHGRGFFMWGPAPDVADDGADS